MTDSRFDRIIKEKLEGYQIDITDDIWPVIEKKVKTRWRRRAMFKVAVPVAAAACLVAGVFLHGNADEPVASLPVISLAKNRVSFHPGIKESLPCRIVSITDQIEHIGGVVTTVPVQNPSLEHDITGDEDLTSNDDDAGESDRIAVISDNTGKYELPDIRDLTTFPDVSSERERNIFSLDFIANSTSASNKAQRMVASAMYSGSILDRNNNALIIEQQSKSRYSMPLSFGVKGSVDINERFSVGVGINYSYLETSFDAYVNKVGYANTSNQIHYLGISLDGYYRFANVDRFNFYIKAGAAVDKGLVQRYVYGSEQVKRGVNGVQVSANAGAGAEFRATNVIGLYIEPTFSYFFDTKQPVSIHTDQPFNFGVAAGARFYIHVPR